ncbi:MAG TPA: MOSC domain-containing protein [Cyanobacteria bacterium UBA11049]|nr:MOSC domain-containing protein [Cyanobacteria bacterium UBA11049]
MIVPQVAGIFIYPIKSLDGVAVSEATVLESGGLKGDRSFAIFDANGNFVNGKRNAKVHLLRSRFNDDFTILSLQIQATEQKFVFDLDKERTALEAWLSDYFGFPVKIEQNTVTGFPDDTNASGPTIISTATLETVASWFPGVSVEQMRLRMRANIEIGGVPSFWEDRLFTVAGKTIKFQIGDVRFEGINPCARCIVPARDAITAEAYPKFQKTFVTKRKETLPSWVETSRFDHFFRLSLNTNVPVSEAGKVLHQGDEVKVVVE